jgi:hypothetical protein
LRAEPYHTVPRACNKTGKAKAPAAQSGGATILPHTM